jgi:hypothetical protein
MGLHGAAEGLAGCPWKASASPWKLLSMFSLPVERLVEKSWRAMGVFAAGDWTRRAFASSAIWKRAFVAAFCRLFFRLCSAGLGLLAFAARMLARGCHC